MISVDGVRTTVEIPDTFNLVAWLLDRHVAEGRGDRLAVVCGDEELTYAELQERANRVGNVLRDLGLRRDERVMVVALDGPGLLDAFFGAMKVGAVPILTNTLLKPADYKYMLNDSRATVLVISEQLLPSFETIPRPELPHLRQVLILGEARLGMESLPALMRQASSKLATVETSKDDAAFWLYSSGTTGFPKGAVHLHHDVVHTVELYAKPILGITQSDRCYSVAKLFFAYGLGNALTFPFALGATTILWPGANTAENVYAQIERYRPTLLFSVPTNYAMLLAHRREGADFDLSCVRLGVSAGEALPKALFDRFKKRFAVEILDGIGSTEVLHIFISNRPGHCRPGSSGQLVPGYEAKVLDEADLPVPQGEIGNLLIKGDSTCAYYWNKHERTKDTVEGHWIRTGDKYWQDEDGYFWYAGRSDDMLKVGGIWVSPVEIENTLVEHAAVAEAAVVGREDKDQLVKPLAYVVLASGVAPSGELATELQDFVRGRIAEYKRPRWIEFVGEIPKTATGKIQRYKLRERSSGSV